MKAVCGGRSINLSGTGNCSGRGGSMLLQKAQGGAGSSYDGLDDYLNQTGVKSGIEPDVRGSGITETNLGRRLGKLFVKPISKKPPRIRLSDKK